MCGYYKLHWPRTSVFVGVFKYRLDLVEFPNEYLLHLWVKMGLGLFDKDEMDFGILVGG